MDTPGILWPRIEDRSLQIKLALIGSMNDEAINKDELCGELIHMLQETAPVVLKERFAVTGEEDITGVLYKVADKLSMLRSGGGSDTDRARDYLMNAFRGGELGRISLERP